MEETETTPVQAFQASTETTVPSFIDYTRIFKWTKLVRSTAYVMCAARIFKDKRSTLPQQTPDRETDQQQFSYRKDFLL